MDPEDLQKEYEWKNSRYKFMSIQHCGVCKDVIDKFYVTDPSQLRCDKCACKCVGCGEHITLGAVSGGNYYHFVCLLRQEIEINTPKRPLKVWPPVGYGGGYFNAFYEG